MARRKQAGDRTADTVQQLLVAAGLKLTRQRRDILRLLLEKHGPFSAPELLQALGPGGCDPVTVYRILESFEAARLVRRCDFGDGTARFEAALGARHHHHLVCTGCQEVEDLDLEECPTKALERSARARGYSQIEHSLELFGLCPRCRTSEKAPSSLRA